MSFFLAYKVPYERSRPGRGGRLRQPHRARRVDLDVVVVELAAGPLVGRRRRVRGRHGLRPQELLAELDAARLRRRRRRRGVVDALGVEDRLRGEARQRQPGERDEDGRYGLLARRRRVVLAVARPLPAVPVPLRRVGAARRTPGIRAGAAAGRASRRVGARRVLPRLAGSRASLARRRRGGRASRPVARAARPARTPAVGGAAAAAVAFVAFAPRCRRASSARVRLWRCTSWACLMAVACWARARARGARFPACGAPPTEARSARGVFPGAGCALGAAWLTVVTCPAPGGASAAATARRDIMRVISTELIFF